MIPVLLYEYAEDLTRRVEFYPKGNPKVCSYIVEREDEPRDPLLEEGEFLQGLYGWAMIMMIDRAQLD